MKLSYKEVRVRMRDGASVITKSVPAWEVPILQAVWPETQEIRDIVVESHRTLTAAGEFDRLTRVYGAERDEGGKQGLPIVAAVYGQHGMGLAALKAAMQSSVLDESTPVTPPPVPPQLDGALVAAIKPEIIKGLESERLQAKARFDALSPEEQEKLIDRVESSATAPQADVVGVIG